MKIDTKPARKARQEASLYCIYHKGCLDKAAKGKWGRGQMPCLSCQKKEFRQDYYKTEMGIDYLSRDDSGGHVIRLDRNELRV